MSAQRDYSTRKVVLVAVGSLGDLHPFMALALSLRARGLSPILATAAEYRSKVEAAGIAFAPLRPSFDEIERHLAMSRAELAQRIIASNQFLLAKAVLPFVREAYEDMLALSADADLLVTSGLAFGARLAAEKRGIDWIAIVLQPMMFLSAYDPPVIPKAEWLSALLRRLGPGPTRILYEAAKRATARLFEPIAGIRAAEGLAPDRRNALIDAQFSPRGTAIGLYSSLLGDVQPDYPARSTVAGFARYDSADGRGAALDPRLEAFMNAGPPPLVFTLGSFIVYSPGVFYRESLIAARRLRRRAVLLVGEAQLSAFASARADDVYIGDYAPHSLLFARAAALIHHGGTGTLAQGLSAGRPQLIVPHFADQLDNAARAVRIGVARTVAPARFTAARATRALAELLGNDAYRERSALVRDRLMAEDGAGRAAAIIIDSLR
ncbi:MAG: glycosyltransferase [Steroidobacteraceae bacterium]